MLSSACATLNSRAHVIPRISPITFRRDARSHRQDPLEAQEPYDVLGFRFNCRSRTSNIFLSSEISER